MKNLVFVCDNYRHLICVPYSIENLHEMAEVLGLKKHWYRKRGILLHPHYDIPVLRIEEIKSKCRVVSRKEIINIIRESL